MYQGLIHASQNACPGCRIPQSFGCCCPNQQIDLHNHCWSVYLKMSLVCEGQFTDFDNSIQKTGGFFSLDSGHWTGILRGML